MSQPSSRVFCWPPVTIHEFDATNEWETDVNATRQRRDRSIAAVVRMGAGLSVDENGNVIHLADASFTDSDVKHFAHFPKLVELELATCNIDDAIWSYLAKMPDLESLTLWGSAITDQGMENLRHLPNLKKLDIRATRITDGGLAHVAQLKMLETLDLLGTRITGNGLVHLHGLNQSQKTLSGSNGSRR